MFLPIQAYLLMQQNNPSTTELSILVKGLETTKPKEELPVSWIDRIRQIVSGSDSYELTRTQSFFCTAIQEVIWQLKGEGYIETKEKR
jgi:hypothetical protein